MTSCGDYDSMTWMIFWCQKEVNQDADLRINQPSVIERNIQQVEDDALRRVLEYSHTCELNVHIQTCLQFMQHCHGIAHVLQREKKEEIIEMQKQVEKTIF